MVKQNAVLIALGVALGAVLYVTRPGPIAPAGIVDITALDKAGRPVRAMAADVVLAPDEALDFHLDLKSPGYAYVFRAVDGRATLEWGPLPNQRAFERGVWAIDWDDERAKGLRFLPGEAKVYVLTAPRPLGEVSDWTEADLKTPAPKCERCSSSVLTVTAISRPPPDAGQ